MDIAEWRLHSLQYDQTLDWAFPNGGILDPREREAAMLGRCVAVVRSTVNTPLAENGREANLFRVAAMVIQSRFPDESKTLMSCAVRYFEIHPDELRPAADVVRNGDVINLPRLRDSLTRILRKRDDR